MNEKKRKKKRSGEFFYRRYFAIVELSVRDINPSDGQSLLDQRRLRILRRFELFSPRLISLYAHQTSPIFSSQVTADPLKDPCGVFFPATDGAGT